jgi:hypothetical protein
MLMVVRAIYCVFLKLRDGLLLIIDENTRWSKLYKIMHIMDFEVFYNFGSSMDCNKFGMGVGVGA